MQLVILSLGFKLKLGAIGASEPQGWHRLACARPLSLETLDAAAAMAAWMLERDKLDAVRLQAKKFFEPNSFD